MSNDLLATSLLNLHEITVIGKRITTIIAVDKISDPLIMKQSEVLNQNIEDLEDAHSTERKSGLTKEIQTALIRLQKAFKRLRNYADVFRDSDDEAQCHAAEIIVSVFRKYGWSLYREGQTKLSAGLKMLVEELNEPELHEALETIKASHWFNLLAEERIHFEELHHQRTQTQAAKKKQTVSEIKAITTRHLSRLTDSLLEVSEHFPEQFGDLRHKLDEIITPIMTTARARKTRNSMESTPDDMPGHRHDDNPQIRLPDSGGDM